MSKALQAVVCELQKSLETLVNKVSELESRIGEQNNVITKQSQLISQLIPPLTDVTTTPTTRKSIPKAVAPVQKALQRPIRQVRLNTALPKSSEKTAAKKGYSAALASVPIAIATPKTAEPNRPTDDCEPTEVGATKDAGLGRATLGEVSLTPSNTKSTETQKDPKATDKNDGEWQQVHSKRNKKCRAVFVGTGNRDNELQTVQRMKYIQAWQFKPETTESMVTNFLNRISKSDEYLVQKRDIGPSRHASFVIGMPELLFDAFESPSVWPQGVRFSDWFLARPRRRGVRGEDRRDVSSSEHCDLAGTSNATT